MAADRTVAQEAAESALVELAKPADERERGMLFSLLKCTLVATATGVASGSAAEVTKELINDLNGIHQVLTGGCPTASPIWTVKASTSSVERPGWIPSVRNRAPRRNPSRHAVSRSSRPGRSVMVSEWICPSCTKSRHIRTAQASPPSRLRPGSGAPVTEFAGSGEAGEERVFGVGPEPLPCLAHHSGQRGRTVTVLQ